MRFRITLGLAIIAVGLLESVYGCGKGKGGKTPPDNGNNGNKNPDNGKPPPNNNNPPASQNPLGDNLQQSPMDNSGYDSKGGKANSPDDLKCDFEGPCCWKNSKPPYDTMEYLKTSGTINPDILQKYFGTSTGPSGNFLSVVSQTAAGAADKAELESCAIACAGGNIKVTLKHWAGNGAKVQVCEVAKSDPNTLLSCQDLPSGNPGPDTVELPPGSDLILSIVATNFVNEGSAVLIDDISVDYPPCTSTTPPGPATTVAGPTPGPAPTQAPPAPDDTEDAKKVCCAFQGDSCSYSKGSGPKSGGGNVQDFSQHSGRWKNPSTGTAPSPDNSYLAAYMKPKEKAYTECNTNFITGKTIKFQEYKATQGISLKACCDTEQGCTYDTGGKVEKGDFRQWYAGSIACPAGTKKVIFYGENNDVNEGGVAIDNVEVYDESGNKIC